MIPSMFLILITGLALVPQQGTDSDARTTKYRWKNINKKRGKQQKDYVMLLT
jgi:hypothetical protein